MAMTLISGAPDRYLVTCGMIKIWPIRVNVMEQGHKQFLGFESLPDLMPLITS